MTHLVDGALGFELGRDVRAADAVGWETGLAQWRLEPRVGLLPGTDLPY